MLWDTFCVCLKLVEKPPNLTVDHDFPMRIAQGSRPFGPLAPDCCRADIFSSLILLEVTMTHGLGSGTHSIWRPVTHATSRYVWSHYAASNSGIVHPCTLFIGPLLRPWHAFELMNGMISPYWTTNRYRMDHDGGIPSWPNILASPGLLDCRWRWCLLPQGCGRAQGENGVPEGWEGFRKCVMIRDCYNHQYYLQIIINSISNRHPWFSRILPYTLIPVRSWYQVVLAGTVWQLLTVSARAIPSCRTWVCGLFIFNQSDIGFLLDTKTSTKIDAVPKYLASTPWIPIYLSALWSIIFPYRVTFGPPFLVSHSYPTVLP